jgi:hypothetical protein
MTSNKRQFEDSDDILQESLKKIRVTVLEESVYLTTQISTKSPYIHNAELGRIIQERIEERDKQNQKTVENHYSDMNQYLGSFHRQRNQL